MRAAGLARGLHAGPRWRCPIGCGLPVRRAAVRATHRAALGAFARTGLGMGRSAAETGKELTFFYGLVKVLKDTTGRTTARSTLQAIVAGAHEPDFSLPGLKPACKPRKSHSSGPAIPADLVDAGTRARWIRAASAELPVGADACGRRVDLGPAGDATQSRQDTDYYACTPTHAHVLTIRRLLVSGGGSARSAVRPSCACAARIVASHRCSPKDRVAGPGSAVAAKAGLPGRVRVNRTWQQGIHRDSPLRGSARRHGAGCGPRAVGLSALFQTATLTETGLIAEEAVLWSLCLSCEPLRRMDSVPQYYLTVRVVFDLHSSPRCRVGAM